MSYSRLAICTTFVASRSFLSWDGPNRGPWISIESFVIYALVCSRRGGLALYSRLCFLLLVYTLVVQSVRMAFCRRRFSRDRVIFKPHVGGVFNASSCVTLMPDTTAQP